MALSEDQKALLRLLAQGDVSIEDIAALKGMSVEQVQAEVSAALGESKAAPEPAKAEEPKESEPVPEPEKPEPAVVAKPKPRKAVSPRAPRPRPSVPPERRRLLALAGGALALIAIVLGAIALIGDDDSGSEGANAAATAQLAGVEDDRVTQAVLEPPDGGDASGSAIFGRIGQKEVVLQVTAEELEPTADGESYTVWLYRTPKLSLRVGAVKAEEGEIGARFPIPPELLAYIGGGAFDQIHVTRTSDAEYQREVAQARKQNRLPRYSGETVLSGEIVGPLTEAAAAAANAGAGNGN
jgi:hypothetical protein